MTRDTMWKIAYANGAGIFPADTEYYCLDTRWKLEMEFRKLRKFKRIVGHKNTRGKLDCFIVFQSCTHAYWYACKTTSANGFAELCRTVKPQLKPPYYDCEMRIAA